MAVMEKEKIALVTGGNKGIGFEVCRQLARRGIQVLLTSRDEKKGAFAQQKLAEENLSVFFHTLDVTQQDDIDRAFEFVKQKWGRLDILINNAGALLDNSRHPPDREGASLFRTSIDVIRASMEVNAFGALRLIQRFVPLMEKHNYGRIINLSSGMGQLSEMNGGWPGYRLSKVAINAITRIASDELQASNILVNSVCPGWVKTDMGGPEAELSAEEGADTVVWLATLPGGSPTGGFFRERKPIEW